MIENEFVALLRDYSNIIAEKKKFIGLVKDMLSDSLHANLLLLLYDMDIHEEIVSVDRITNTFGYRFVKRLMDERGISKLHADWAVSVWCVCYGNTVLGRPCDITISNAKKSGVLSITDEQPTTGKQYHDLFTYEKDSCGGYSITGFIGDNFRTLILPNAYRNKSVTSISTSAFQGCEVQEVVMTDGIIEIGNGAFEDCTELKQVIFSESLKTIGDNAFLNCGKLITAMLPKIVERTGAYAFSKTGIRTVAFPDSVYSLGEGSYSHCVGISALEIPASIEELPDRVFEGCTSLNKIALPDNLRKIGSFAFAGCVNLPFISVPDNVTEIGEDAFSKVDARFILQCGKNSVAESYARKYGIRFQLG